MMMMVLCPKAGSWAFTPPWDEKSEVVSHCLPHRQLWVATCSRLLYSGLNVKEDLAAQGMHIREAVDNSRNRRIWRSLVEASSLATA